MSRRDSSEPSLLLRNLRYPVGQSQSLASPIELLHHSITPLSLRLPII